MNWSPDSATQFAAATELALYARAEQLKGAPMTNTIATRHLLCQHLRTVDPADQSTWRPWREFSLDGHTIYLCVEFCCSYAVDLLSGKHVEDSQ